MELDLLVGEKLAESGTRSANIRPHDKMTARRVPGLETAIVDRSPMTITALDGSGRSAEVNVAGPAALLVAKAHKIHDRLGSQGRLTNKDAGDVYRLMVATTQHEVVTSLRILVDNPLVGEVTTNGLQYLREQFGGPAAPGVLLAVEALAGDIPASASVSLRPPTSRRCMSWPDTVTRSWRAPATSSRNPVRRAQFRSPRWRG